MDNNNSRWTKPSAHFEHTIVVRKDKAEILSSFKEIEEVLSIIWLNKLNIELDGTIKQALSNAMFSVELENGHEVLQLIFLVK